MRLSEIGVRKPKAEQKTLGLESLRLYSAYLTSTIPAHGCAQDTTSVQRIHGLDLRGSSTGEKTSAQRFIYWPQRLTGECARDFNARKGMTVATKKRSAMQFAGNERVVDPANAGRVQLHSSYVNETSKTLV